jgi:hypothetical protein
MRRFLHLFCFSIVFSLAPLSYAQDICGYQAYIEYLESENPGIKQNIDVTFLEAVKKSRFKNKNTQDTVYKVNIVFHVVYNNELQNVNDSFIYSQLKVLNDAFRRTNSDTVNTRDIFKPVAADVGVEFVLPKIDPLGNPSNGIIREQTVRETFGSLPTNLSRSDLVKNGQVGSAPWDTEKYMNVWICDLSANGFDGLLGYAYPPTGAGNWAGSNSFTSSDKQGVVVHYKVIGENNPESLATGSKTLVHEVGHYLGLRHIWGDGGCAVDDFMDDTPRARAASRGCDIGVNTCTEPDGGQFPDMLENYMDYSSDVCQNLFTNDQAAQMRANLTTFRSGIYETEIAVEDEVGSEQISFEGSLLYPNPTLNKLNVYLKEVDVNSSYTLSIYTLLGQECKQVQLEAKQYQVLTGFLDLRGMYLYRVRVNDNDAVLEGKIIFGM